MADEKGHAFELECGVSLPLRRVNSILVAKIGQKAEDDWIAEHGQPTCPEYEINIAGGAIERHPHNDITIQTEPWSEDKELQERYRDYKRQQRELMSIRTEASTRAYVIEGVDAAPTDEWREKRAFYGLTLPDDPRDQKWEWVEDICSGWAELLQLATAIQLYPNKVEEIARIAESLFRGPLGASGEGEDSTGDAGDSTPEPEDA